MSLNDKGCFEMDAGTKQYLDDFKQDIKESLQAIEKHIRELIESSIKPIEKQVDKHTIDIEQLYNFDREKRERDGKVEGRVKILEDDKQQHQFSTEMKIVIGIAIATMLVSIALAIFL